MKISFSTLGCPRWTWNDIIATAHDLGYDGVEVRGVGQDISVPSVPEFGEDQLESTLAQLRRMNLSVPCLASDCCLHLRERHEQTNREVRAYVDLARKMGVPYVRVMGAPAVPQPTGTVDEGYVREALCQAGEYAGQQGVALLVETNGVWSNSKKLAGLIREVNSPNVMALWDINHPFFFAGESPQTTYENLRPYLRHMHIKDAVKAEDRLRYTMLGYGQLPLAEIVQILQKGGYEGYYSLEWVKRWDTTLEEPGIVFAHYVNYMRSFEGR